MGEVARFKKSFEISELNDDVFDLDLSIELAIENLQRVEMNEFSKLNFHNNLWQLYDEEKDSMLYFRFNRLEEELQDEHFDRVESNSSNEMLGS
ncbi:hypothetical protein P9Z24_23075 [Bacillus cereus]|nr:hypothetical protein [Bacillus cereus]